jgi:hypothetical protein
VADQALVELHCPSLWNEKPSLRSPGERVPKSWCYS